MHDATLYAFCMTDVSERLRLARQNAGFATASEAAERFGWRPPTYLSHENGHRGVTTAKLRVYAAAFRVPVEWLLSGAGAPPIAGMAEGPAPPPDPLPAARIERPTLNHTNFEVRNGVAELYAVANLKGIAQVRRYLDIIEAALTEAKADH